MSSKLKLLIVCLVVVLFSQTARAQCTAANLVPVSQLDRDSLVIDVRPDQINQFRGKSSFKNQARIALVNMNPFLFSYSLKVDQTEIQDTGFLNFLKLLGSPVSDLIGSVSASSRNKALNATTGGNLNLLITRTEALVTLSASCPANESGDARNALAELRNLRVAVLNALDGPRGGAGLRANINARTGQYATAEAAFDARKDVIFSTSVDATQLCNNANSLHGQLTAAAYPDVATIRNLLVEIRDFKSLVTELESSAEAYKSEYETCPARLASGFSYADNLIRLANELSKLGQAYETKATAMLEETKSFDALVKTIASLNTHEQELLQKQYIVESRYDISALDITATAVPLGGDSPATPTRGSRDQRVVGDISNAQSAGDSAQASARIVNVGETENAQGVKVFAPHRAQFRSQAQAAGDDDNGQGNGGGGSGPTGAKQIKTTGVIGARRFQISGGMAFSSLGRREFQPVLGFARNADGEIIDPETNKPTDDRKLTNIVGLSESSSRRFAPIGMLHYRLPYTRNIFASVGLTGKRDDYGVDLEYLIGPSVLYKNLFLTFGGYAGKQQRLAGDLFEGAAIEGDAIPVRKDYKWGFGFSLTFKIPLGDKQTQE